jgi:hypothetical protein
MGWMGQPVMPNGCKRLRSDGVQATKTLAKVQSMIQTAWAKGAAVGKGAGTRLARLTSRQRYAHSTGRDPCRGPHWQRAMALCCLWHPTDGVSYDEGDVSKRGTSAATAQRAGP